MTDKPFNVVPLRAVDKDSNGSTERSLWVCLCGCFSFRLFDDGGIQCAKCGRWSEDARAVFADA